MLSDDERAAFEAVVIGTSDEVFEKAPLGAMENLFAAGIKFAQTWRSMESAPKDGTVIVLGNQDGSWIAQWLEYYPSGYRAANPWFSLMLNRDYMGRKYVPPTHWMPLPLPPTEAK